MGLIKAVIGAAAGTIADQWLEFFYCDALPADVLVRRGRKRTSGRSGNSGSDNIISNGSRIAVADGQCMIIVEQGKVVEVCAEPGEFTYDTSTEPSIFTGGLGEGIRNTFRTMGKRFTFGGEPPKDQRVYYFNMKSIIGNKFGTPNPVSFRVVDNKIGLDIDLSLRVNGTYAYRIADPLLFYTNVCGNVADEYTRTTDDFDTQMRTEFIDKLGQGLAKLSELELRPNQIPAHTDALKDGMNEGLSREWREMRGIEIVKIAVNPPTLTEEDQKLLKEAQRSGMLRDPSMGAGAFMAAQTDAMRAAASNEGGAMIGFAGMGMAANAGGGMAQNLYAMGAQQQQMQTPPQAGGAAGSWKCSCGTTNTGKFCTECGKTKPAEQGWSCSCGAVNKGKFCTECGKPRPAGAPLYRCDKCGWTPPDPHKPPKFCPQCGDPFDENDIQ